VGILAEQGSVRTRGAWIPAEQGCSCLMQSWWLVGPKRQGSWRGVALVVPCIAVAQQGVRGGGLWGGHPGRSWILHRAGAWHSPRGGYPGRDAVVSRRAGAQWGPRGGDPGVWVQHRAGASCGPKGRDPRQSGAAALQAYGAGTWQAGSSFRRLWSGEAFHDLGV
jgi:hypothetical protein